MRRLPIRVRMTVAFAMAMVFVLAAAGLFVFVRQRSDLDDTINSGLSSRSDDVAALIRRSAAGLGESRFGRLAESEESFVQILTPDGRWIDGTSKVRTPALPPEDARSATRGPTVFERKVAGVDGTARMLARPVAAPRRLLVVAVAGTSLEDRDDALSGLLTSFLIGGPAAILLASGAVYLLATAAFRPVEAMRQRAMRISMSRGGERLPLPAAKDEIRRLGETLNQMLDRLEASFERERRFVADASHELRTPIAVLKAELEVALRSGTDGAEVKESLIVALEETDHLAQLAGDLLLIARATDDRLPVEREDVRVRDLLEITRERFADRARQQNREIRVSAPEELDVSVDPLRARQALGNLVANALRHGGGDIHLSARRNHEAVEIDVHDEGSGFPAEFAPRAFERFARAETGARSGAGLGLAIVRTIAEAHGGTATIVENSSAGATVRLSIPLSADQRRSAQLLSPTTPN